jgi:hypothetical protein
LVNASMTAMQIPLQRSAIFDRLNEAEAAFGFA